MRTIIPSLVADLRAGFQSIFATRGRILALLILFLIFFAFMFAIPVLNVPGNNIFFQAALYTPAAYVTLIALAFFSALSVLLQWLAFRTNTLSANAAAGTTTLGVSGVAAGVISSIFASASCLTCVGAFFGFLGFQGIVFLVEHRLFVLAAAFLLIGASIVLASRKIRRGCETCTISSP